MNRLKTSVSFTNNKVFLYVLSVLSRRDPNFDRGEDRVLCR